MKAPALPLSAVYEIARLGYELPLPEAEFGVATSSTVPTAAPEGAS